MLKKHYHNPKNNWDSIWTIATSLQLWFLSNIPGEDGCKGDSGGPLVAYEGTNPSQNWKNPKYLVGIVSFGTSKCGQGIPTAYSSIDYYLPWILDNMKP